MQPTRVFLLGEFHGQRSFVDYSLWSCIESDTHTAGSLSTPSAYPQPIAMWLSLLSTDGAHALQGAETLMPISFLVFCALSRACLPCFLEPLNPLSIHQPSCPPPSLPSVILPSTSPSFQYPSTSPAITFCWAHLKKSLYIYRKIMNVVLAIRKLTQKMWFSRTFRI